MPWLSRVRVCCCQGSKKGTDSGHNSKENDAIKPCGLKQFIVTALQKKKKKKLKSQIMTLWSWYLTDIFLKMNGTQGKYLILLVAVGGDRENKTQNLIFQVKIRSFENLYLSP